MEKLIRLGWLTSSGSQVSKKSKGLQGPGNGTEWLVTEMEKIG